MREHRRSLVVVRDGTERTATAEWDEEDRLGVTIDAQTFRVESQGDSHREVEALLEELAGAGFSVSCCGTCRFFVHGGMGADTGSSIGCCSEGKASRQWTQADYTSMTDSCGAFSTR
jgi:hypothetical protein